MKAHTTAMKEAAQQWLEAKRNSATPTTAISTTTTHLVQLERLNHESMELWEKLIADRGAHQCALGDLQLASRRIELHKAHLAVALQTCRAFEPMNDPEALEKSCDLVPEAAFIAQAIGDTARPAADASAAQLHEWIHKRLSFDRDRREELAKTRGTLTSKKAKLEAQIKTIEAFNKHIPNQVQLLLNEAGQPLSDFLGLDPLEGVMPTTSANWSRSMESLYANLRACAVTAPEYSMLKVKRVSDTVRLSFGLPLMLEFKLSVTTGTRAVSKHPTVQVVPDPSASERGLVPLHSNPLHGVLPGKDPIWRWVSWLCNTDLPSDLQASPLAHARWVVDLVDSLAARLKVATALSKQISQLSKLQIPSVVRDQAPTAMRQHGGYAGHPDTVITAFTLDTLNEEEKGFHIEFSSGSAGMLTVTMAVKIPVDYPVRPPKWHFEKTSNPTGVFGMDSILRAIEGRVNTTISTADDVQLLAKQTNTLMPLLDVLFDAQRPIAPTRNGEVTIQSIRMGRDRRLLLCQ